HEAAPQVVEQFPHRQGCERVWLLLRLRSIRPGWSWHARQQPAGELPVAAYPPVSPTGFRRVTGRVLFDEFDIGHQRRTRIAAFQQVVTENEILRKASVDRLTKGIHVIDALADE